MQNRKTKKALAEKLRALVAADLRWAALCLVKVWRNQTPAERAIEETVVRNGVGFSGRDAQFGSMLAAQADQWLNTPRHERKFNRPLSQRQAPYAHTIARRYIGQFTDAMLRDHPAECAKLLNEPAPLIGEGARNAGDTIGM